MSYDFNAVLSAVMILFPVIKFISIIKNSQTLVFYTFKCNRVQVMNKILGCLLNYCDKIIISFSIVPGFFFLHTPKFTSSCLSNKLSAQ